MMTTVNSAKKVSGNSPLKKANAAKNDEFYTQLTDIENELKHYKQHFKGKTVFCNCDDPRISNFFKYFSLNFETLGLKKLITTCYKSQDMNHFSKNDSEKAIKLEYDGDKNNNKVPDPNEIGIIHLESDGDFRSQECIEILKQADIVCTNPPFSLFREYVEQLMKYKKKFLIIGTWNAVAYKEIFKLLMKNDVWIGFNTNRNFSGFIVPHNYSSPKEETHIDENGNKIIFTGHNCWFTNLDIKKRHEDLMLFKKYNKTEYPKYYNYNAINVNKTKEIPTNFKGKMGVPISFMDKYNPDQFEIIGLAADKREIHDVNIQGKPVYLDKQHKKFVGMVLKEKNKLQTTYSRIIIKHKRKTK